MGEFGELEVCRQHLRWNSDLCILHRIRYAERNVVLLKNYQAIELNQVHNHKETNKVKKGEPEVGRLCSVNSQLCVQKPHGFHEDNSSFCQH